MDFTRIDRWPRTKAEAQVMQAEAAVQVVLRNEVGEPHVIAAVDTAYGEDGEYVYAGAVTVSFPEMREVERATSQARVAFPYVPGLLFFREGPAIVEALGGLTVEPDVIIVHGHGLAHPERCGMASQAGVLFKRPTIGCCRKLLAGKHRPVGEAKGNCEEIMLGNTPVGWAYRSKDRVKPIFLSPGHRCDLATAREVIVRSLLGFRLPEPLRLAHLFANKHKRLVESRLSGRRNSSETPH